MSQTFIPTRKAAPLPGTVLIGLDAHDPVTLSVQLRRGVRPAAVDRLARQIGVGVQRVLRVIAVGDSTYYQLKREEKRLGSDPTHRLYNLARAIEAAEDYFEDKPLAHAWLRTPHPEFGGVAPLGYAATLEGAQQVLTVLARAEHGIY